MSTDNFSYQHSNTQVAAPVHRICNSANAHPQSVTPVSVNPQETTSNLSADNTSSSISSKPISRMNKKFIQYPNLLFPTLMEGKNAAKRILVCPFGYLVANRTGGTGCHPTWRCSCPGHPQVRVAKKEGENSFFLEYDWTRFHEHSGARMPVVVPRVGEEVASVGAPNLKTLTTIYEKTNSRPSMVEVEQQLLTTLH